MGSVVISGSTSGTVTVSAPAEAGTRTLTLPAATGTAILEDGSNNLQMNSGFGSSATAYGVRAWVNFNGTGTVAIRASGNVSSITDNATGDYTVNFATNMPDVNYSVASNNHAQADHIFVGGVLTYNTGSVRMYFGTTGAVGTAANTRVDATNYGISVFR